MLCRVTAAGLVRTAAAVVFLVSVWHANTGICPGCTSRPLAIELPGGTVRGVLYLPPDRSAPLPLVVVSHGFLASGVFMHVPWAADLTHLGAAAFFLDRWGHGTSDGRWWPATPPEIRSAADLAPDLTGALARLRGLAPLIDPRRVALLGHSDGGTASLLAGSADWGLRATVALSSSAAPWELLNHATPRNLLLLFGGDDQIVTVEDRHLMISAATRGYLAGPGDYGSLSRGSARALHTIPAAGHVGLLYADASRREALEWTARALDLGPSVQLSDLRFGWIWLGLLALPAVLWWPRDAPAAPRRRAGAGLGSQTACALILVAGWIVGLTLVPRWALHTRALPAQETATVAALLMAETLTVGAVLGALIWVRRLVGSPTVDHQTWRTTATGVRAGVGAALITGAAIHLLCWHLIAHPTDLSRIALGGLYAGVSLPFFATIDAAITRTIAARAGQAIFILLAAGSLALLAPQLALRMGVLPIYLLSAALGLLALSLAGGAATTWGTIGRACFAAQLFGRAIAVTCPLF